MFVYCVPNMLDGFESTFFLLGYTFSTGLTALIATICLAASSFCLIVAFGSSMIVISILSVRLMKDGGGLDILCIK